MVTAMLRPRRTLLACLAMNVMTGMVALLPSARADTNSTLFDAIRQDDLKTIRDLLLKGASTEVPDRTHGPALVYAARIGSFKAMRALLETPLVDTNARSTANENALMYVAMAGRVDMAELLLRRGVEINKAGWTPLHYAVLGGSAEMLTWLLEHDAYIDAESPNGTTPLMLAAREHKEALVRMLILQGADPLMANESGATALDYVERGGDTALADWMRARSREFAAKYGTRENPVKAR